MKYLKIFVLLATALVLVACSFTVNLPKVDTGVTQTLDVNEPPLDGVDVNRVEIEAGPCALTVTGGAESLLQGTVQYNVNAWKPTITRTSDTVTLKQSTEVQIGTVNGTIRNVWDLKLGEMPLDLMVATGASDSTFSLGGLAITRLTISDGASKTRVRFDSPNLAEMSTFSYSTGASEVKIFGLGNANAQLVTFEGGVGAYELDFSGELTRELQVNIDAGISEVKLIFPADAHVRVNSSGELKNVDLNGTWTVNGSVYEYGSNGPLITVNINMALGNLQLIQK